MKNKKNDILNLLMELNIITNKGKLNPNKHLIFKKNKSTLTDIEDVTSFLCGSGITINERIYCLIYNISIQHTCKHCNAIMRLDLQKSDYRTFCSVKCSKNDVDIIAATKATNQERYGAISPMKNDKIKNKVSQTQLCFSDAKKKQKRKKYEDTCLAKYGVVNASMTETVKTKTMKTNIERYGDVCPARNKLVAEKIKQNHQKRLFGNINNKSFLAQENENSSLIEISKKLDVSHSVVSTRFAKFEIPVKLHNNKSTIHDEIYAWIKLVYSGTILENDRKILNNKEIDILLPELNLGIEIDGIYWHGEIIGNKNRTYHLNKTITAKKHNIKLLHIYDIEWMYNKEIVKSRILSHIGMLRKIYGRNCVIKKIDYSIANSFFTINHLQGAANTSIHFGLYYENELVACMSFSKSRFNNSHEWELVRFCNILNCTVLGGASKLFKHFCKLNSPNTIISYSDKRWGDGNMYKHLGFEFLHTSAPNFKYTKNGKMFGRMMFQKHKLEGKIKIFDENLSAWENMKNNGYDRIWDCGNDVWSFTQPQI